MYLQGIGNDTGVQLQVFAADANQIGSTYTVSQEGTSVADNNGAGWTGARYIKLSHPNAYLAGYEIQVFTKSSFTPVVTFDPDANAADPKASFSHAGQYVLKLEANDGADTRSDTVTVEVLPPTFTLDAGPGGSVDMPDSFQLNSTVTWPTGPVSYHWSMLRGASDGKNIAPLGTVAGNLDMNGGNAILIDGKVVQQTYNSSGTNAWWTLTLDKTYNIDYIRMYLQYTINDIGVQLQVFAEDGITQIGDTFTVSQQGNAVANNNSAGWNGARYVKVTHPGGYLVSSEIQVFTKSSFTPVVTFDPNAYVADPKASFSHAGQYVLQLEANDGSETLTDTVTVVAVPMNAGRNFGVVLPATGQLNGTSVNLPDPVVYNWTYEDYYYLMDVAKTGVATGTGGMNDPALAIDGKESTLYWTRDDGTGSLKIDFGATYDLREIKFTVQRELEDRMLGSTVKCLAADGNDIIGSIYTVTTSEYSHTVDDPNGTGWNGVRYLLFEQTQPKSLGLTEVSAFTKQPPMPTAIFDPNNAGSSCYLW